MASRRTNSTETPAQFGECSLRGAVTRRFFRGPDPSLLQELYIPMLSNCVRYDRSCAYYSSSSLAVAARGFAQLIQRLEGKGSQVPRPAVRLFVNEELSEPDAKALTETGDAVVLADTLKGRFKDPKDWLERKRLEALGWLVKRGLLEVRVGVMRNTGGINHAKFGIATDARGDSLVFSGSANESAHGLRQNYEHLEVSTSWDDRERFEHYSEEFRLLWDGDHPQVRTHSLPEALKEKLIKFAPDEPPIVEPSISLELQKCAMRWQFIREAAFLPGGAAAGDAMGMVDLWPHQRRVVEETAEAWPEGRLLCDEVGLGKTIEAIMILRRLMAGRGVRRVLFLLPAGLLKQWQEELREKGGLVIPRLEGSMLIWPDGPERKVRDLAEALEVETLLLSRETARTEGNSPVILRARPWDLVVLDEAHAARRRKQEEGEFNVGTLLLDLARRLQLQRRARGFLFLSATPMQTHPWEPWDLLSVLGEGGRWLASFDPVRTYYSAIARLSRGSCDLATAQKAAVLVADDTRIQPPSGLGLDPRNATQTAQRLAFAPSRERDGLVRWLRRSSPLARRMHRNTRDTLRAYHARGLLEAPPAERDVRDEVFDYGDPAEREVYESITRYINKRFEELEEEKPGKGFVMTIYRRRAASSPRALERSLRRRLEGLRQVEEQRARDPYLVEEEATELGELGDSDTPGKISSAFPDDPEKARAERHEVERILDGLAALVGKDSKLDRFFEKLREVTDDGRRTLVFTEYTDTMEYLREKLLGSYGCSLACYSGNGGERWNGSEWVTVPKDEIPRALHAGEIRLMICTDAASEGLNLQAAGAVVNYDLPWNPSKVEQRIGRVDRIGQEIPVIRVVNLFLRESIDEKVYGVLRRRCGLFTRFVGRMQPVLSRARKMLLRLEAAGPDSLEAAAEEVEADDVGAETYQESEPESTHAAPPFTRKDIEEALRALPPEGGVLARERNGVFEVRGEGVHKTKVSCRTDALEHNPSLVPLVAEAEVVGEISSTLARKAGSLPLTIGSFNNGAFRSSEILWVEDRSAFPVTSLAELEDRMKAWEGQSPDDEAIRTALQMAEGKAKERVESMMTAAREREADGLKAQLTAARERLMRELAVFLACHRQGIGDPNGLMHRLMSGEHGSAERVSHCYDKLGGYPNWSPQMLRDSEEIVSRLTEGQLKARLLGKELDAALQDPRWAAK